MTRQVFSEHARLCLPASRSSLCRFKRSLGVLRFLAPCVFPRGGLRALSAVCAFHLGAAALAWGQAGYYVYPSLSVTEYYDDNIFRSAAGKQEDLITRVSAGLRGGYDSEPVRLLGHYNFASGIFAQHPRLTKALSMQNTGGLLRYLPTPLWTLGFTGSYIETERPETLNVTTGVLGSRRKARNFTLTPSTQYRWDPLTTLSGDYLYSESKQIGGAATDLHSVRLTFDRRLSDFDAFHFSYLARYYHSMNSRLDAESGGREDRSTSHVGLIGWTRQLSPLTSATLSAGPRVSPGRVTPEVLATVARVLQYGKLVFTYGRTENVVIGRGRPVTTDRVLLSWDRQWLERLLVTVTPGFYNNTEADFATQVYRFDAEALYQINKWLAFRGLYQLYYEQGGLVQTGGGGGDRVRNVVLFELVMASPFRLY